MKPYHYALLRYVHHAAAGEFVNIGIVMWLLIGFATSGMLAHVVHVQNALDAARLPYPVGSVGQKCGPGLEWGRKRSGNDFTP